MEKIVLIATLFGVVVFALNILLFIFQSLNIF
jgi:hypothetical protein